MSSDSPNTRLDRLAMALAILAFSTAFLFTASSAAMVQRYGPFLFALCLGLALIVWGRSAQLTGRIKGTRTYIYRSERPQLFYLFLLVKRFAPGLVMVVAGIWYGLFRTGQTL